MGPPIINDFITQLSASSQTAVLDMTYTKGLILVDSQDPNPTPTTLSIENCVYSDVAELSWQPARAEWILKDIHTPPMRSSFGTWETQATPHRSVPFSVRGQIAPQKVLVLATQFS
jgi:hypothetical protein